MVIQILLFDRHFLRNEPITLKVNIIMSRKRDGIMVVNVKTWPLKQILVLVLKTRINSREVDRCPIYKHFMDNISTEMTSLSFDNYVCQYL